MSTKIYEGMRFPKTKLTHFTHTVRTAHYRLVLEQARHLAARLRPTELRKDTWNYRVQAITDLFRKISAESFRRPGLDLECGWRIWLPERSRYAYTVPWGEYLTRRELVLPDYVEDYCYWDNTDPPEGMRDGDGYRRWRRRRRGWECATDPRAQSNVLQMFVFEAKDHLMAALYVDLQKAGMPSAIDMLAAVATTRR